MIDLWIGLCGSVRFSLYMREGGKVISWLYDSSLLFLEQEGGIS